MSVTAVAQAQDSGAPSYTNHAAPAGMGDDAGEPTLGVNPGTGRVLYQAGLETLRVTFDDSVSPADATWEDVSFTLTSVATLDPFLVTDRGTGRTIVAQLAGACSLSAFTDDDGENWTPSEGCGTPAGVDHQSYGMGPYADVPVVGRPENPIYPNAVYYCSQSIAAAICARSDTGGLAYGAGVPIYNLTQCGGLHGHIVVGPEGAAYVPNKGCGDNQAVVVSEDNGISWAIRPVPASTPSNNDPSAAAGAGGTVYFGYSHGDGPPHVAVSSDRGKTWVRDTDVGETLGIKAAVFPAVVAGDDDRAAFTFLGTTTEGDFESPDFPGVWHLYVATTFDGGQSWVTVDATPNDPVQRGGICLQGVACEGNRNLLDFMDITADEKGRVLVSYADGCIGDCVSGPPNSFSAKAKIARQVSGKRLAAEFDP